MSLERDLKLAQAESRIEQAERNIRQVETLLPQLSAQGISTADEGRGAAAERDSGHLSEQGRHYRLIVSDPLTGPLHEVPA